MRVSLGHRLWSRPNLNLLNSIKQFIFTIIIIAGDKYNNTCIYIHIYIHIHKLSICIIYYLYPSFIGRIYQTRHLAAILHSAPSSRALQDHETERWFLSGRSHHADLGGMDLSSIHDDFKHFAVSKTCQGYNPCITKSLSLSRCS
jgi:hypothetical protein